MSARGFTRRCLLRLAAWAGPIALGLAAPGPAAQALPLRTGGALGRAYLRARPHEAAPGLLLRLLALPEPRAGLASAANARWLAARHEADFRRGRVLEIGGWILSQTELRVAAWVWLDRPARRTGATRAHPATPHGR